MPDKRKVVYQSTPIHYRGKSIPGYQDTHRHIEHIGEFEYSHLTARSWSLHCCLDDPLPGHLNGSLFNAHCTHEHTSCTSWTCTRYPLWMWLNTFVVKMSVLSLMQMNIDGAKILGRISSHLNRVYNSTYICHFITISLLPRDQGEEAHEIVKMAAAEMRELTASKNTLHQDTDIMGSDQFKMISDVDTVLVEIAAFDCAMTILKYASPFLYTWDRCI